VTDTLTLGLAGLVLGLCAGSFVGTLAVRAPEDWASLWRGRSACPSCGTHLGPHDLVPLASYAVARGRCRHCGAPIGRYYPAVEVAAGLIGAVPLALLPTAQALVAAVLGWWLLALALIDLRCFRLPDALTLPLLLAGLLVALGSERLDWPLRAPAFLDALAGAAAGAGGLYLVAAAYAALRRREGMGMGDAKLAGVAGAWLGWQPLPLMLLLAATGTLVVVIAGRSEELRAGTALPLGPGLAAAMFVLYLWLVA
jgi:leader peptidase (prepilin peptidase)/N-methyltransferase